VCCMMAMLSGSCTNLGAATSEYCSVARPIYVSKDDLVCMTDLTARQILDHNEAGQAICGWKAK
jgi:hypothetical protein